ncbi:histone acetylation domain containing protein [Nitzschia inconspicua]|uniref:histone acetyltransferase n=1 Tax=Nitzschia inconspicua TaxID=303405 RepID=A0A9K3M2Y4_9STRA|nr:histone acetylation domain containing protein [Nitzschia inconspicua]
MMVPFDGAAPGQQQQGVAPAPMPRPPMPPGHQSVASPGMHNPQMNAGYPGMHRNVSSGMPNGYPNQMPSQSPRNSFSMPGGPGVPPQGGYSGHPPLHSPANQPMGHPNMGPQMHRNSAGSGGGMSNMGMPPSMPPQQPHDGRMMSGSSRGNQQYSMGNSMGGNGGMNTSMNNHWMSNAMGNSMNAMGNSMNSSMNAGNPMNNSMNNSMNMGGHSINLGGNVMMSNGVNSSRGNQLGSSRGGNSNGMNGNWQTDRDTPHRREMIQHIVKMLKKDRSGSQEWLSKLPQMAKQLEVSLYRNARSFDAYMDMNTLKQRLQQIAVQVSQKARSQEQRHDRHRDSQPSNNGVRQENSSPYMGNSATNANSNINNNTSSGGMQAMGGNMNMSSSSGTYNHSMNNSSSSGANMPGIGGPSGRNDPEWKVRIRHKQQRLLLLHHSAKCPHEDGRCPTTPHCADMKRLWRHMEGCKDNQCRVSHCFSSRAILSHYRKCKDNACPACGPVRETVRKTQGNRAAPGNSRPPGSGLPNAVNSVNASQRSVINDMSSRSASSYPTQPMSGQPSFPPQPQQASAMPPPNNQVVNSSMTFPPPVPNTSSSQVSYRPAESSSLRNGPQGLGNDFSSNSITSGGSSGSANNQNSTSSRRNDSEWQKVRHKQQRLLLLRHASRCQYDEKCPVTPHCASMKKLWEHIAHCKNQQCEVPHCMSSRYVLSHYRRCKDPRCPACAPVRETIRKSHEKEQSQGNRMSNSNSFEKAPLHEPTGSDGSPDMTRATKKPKLEVSSPSGGQMAPLSSGFQQQEPEPPSAPPSAPVLTQPVKEESNPAASVSTKGNDDCSLLNSFTVEQLSTHLKSLNRSSELPPAKLKQKCSEVLKGLQTHQHGWVFNCPVDPVELGLPDYFEIIKKPMDLGTVHKKLDSGAYHAIKDFYADVNLTFDNAMTYNEKGSVVFDMAKELKTKFEVDYKKMVQQLETEDRERRENERACVLCGCEKRLFEPPVFFCNGMNCASKRIRRNSHFYIGGNNQYFWCNQCYNELEDKSPIELIDLTISKADLKKKKNDEVHEESWVQCDVCEKWIHQICGLFNTRQNKEHHSEYCCPLCLLDKRKDKPFTLPPKPPGAADLPRTKLSEFLETHLAKRIAQKRRQLTEEKQKTENVSLDEALKYATEGGAVIIRQVTSMDRKLEVRDRMKNRYAHKKYPDEFPFRCKCLVVFQEIDGVDVVLFALYVYEHGEDCPEPNKRSVYISYLDSVHFMRPRKLRTFVYHEILIAYLDYARQRSFSTAHIWACPPLKGDDYIFYAKPEDQKTPRDSRLRQWYIDMLTDCQKRDIVGKVTNMYDLYFTNEALDASAVPYHEGDYFPGEAENIIKMLEEGGGKKGGNNGKKKKQKNQSKSKNRGGTRSTGVDEEALIASGMMDGVKDFSELDRDQVMVKLGETIQPMKDSFIVAFLNWSGAKKEDMEVPEDIMAYRKENPEMIAPLISGNKRDADGQIKDEAGPVDANGRPIKVIDDDAEDLDCEFLNNRQAFLNLCRGNHYQFDELRRAKHTSMMVLWHLHNRDAPKFVQQCVACSREILSGKRYHCASCPDYDLCEQCYSDPKTNRGSCTHKLQAIAVENQSDSSNQGLTEAQRKQRQRNLMLHIQLIEHASRCTSTSCSSTNCAKMKNYLQHARICKTKVQGGCRICKRIWTLLRIHAQKCKDAVCPIPQCMVIREKMRELQKQQQAMDDRRRQEMNRHYNRMNMAGAAVH